MSVGAQWVLVGMVFACLVMLPVSRDYPFRTLALVVIIGSAMLLLFREVTS